MQLTQSCTGYIRTACKTVVFALVLLFLTGNPLQAQQGNAVLQQKITLQLQQVSVADVLMAIGNQASCKFAYSSNQLNARRIVNVNYTNITIEEAVKQLLGEQLKRLRVNGQQIFLQTGNERGIVKGSVVTSDGKPAQGVTLLLKGTSHTTTSREDGSFRLEAAEGNYEIVASFVGLQTQQQPVIIAADNTATISFTLQENSEQLKEIIVTSAKHTRFANKESGYVAKIPLKNLENPQVYSAVSKELIAEQVITDFSNVLKNTPGVYKVQGNRGINSDGATFYSIRGFRTEASLTDGIPMQTNGENDPANIEKVEVLKGPSATMYGGAITNLGGLINIVTKRPVDTLGGEVSYTTGSFGLNRITADVYGPANKNNNLFVRVNAAYQYQSSWQDAGFRKTTLLAPSVEYRASDKLTIHLNGTFYSGEGTSPAAIFLARTRQFIAHTPQELNYDWKRSYTNNDITMKTPTTNIYGKITYKLSGQWTSQTSFSSNNRKSDGIYQYQFIRGATDERVERNVSMHNVSNNIIDIQENLTGDFKVGGIRNRLVFGLDYMQQKANNSISNYVAYDTINATQNDPRYGIISSAGIQAKIATFTSDLTRNYSTVDMYSTYASDVVNITDQLMAMLSIRVDRYDSKGTVNRNTGLLTRDSKFDKNTISSKFGLVYQVIKDQVSVFGNYMNGFLYQAPVVQPVPEISGVLKPQQANQWEGGVKLDILKNRLSFTASYYDISVTNATRTEPYVKDGTTYNITVQDGTQNSKGYELELQTNPAEGFNLIAGYGHNNSTLTKATPALEGRRPVMAGPADLVNCWGSYALQRGQLKGLGLGFGGNYVGEHMTANSAATGVFTLPSYTLLNATAFYDTKGYRISVKLDNITNQLYFTGQGTLTAQMPRSFSANLTVRF